MREIKFNYYNTHNGKYTRWEESNAALMMCSFGTYKHLRFLQYTGLTDKNGVEIFEGDVIRFIIPERHSVIKGNGYEDIQTDKGFEVNGVVKFLHAMWFIEEVGGKGVPLDFDEEQITEVVGNIYENPELLGD